MKFLLDTDHISILQREANVECEAIRSHVRTRGAKQVAVSVVSFHEQALGANALIARAKTVEQVVEGYDLFRTLLSYYSRSRVLDFDEAPAQVAYNLSPRRIRIKLMDLRIAATAIAHDLTLVTRNTVDFERVPGLRIEDWTR